MKKVIVLILINVSILFSQVSNDLMQSIYDNNIEEVKNIVRDGYNLDIFDSKYNMTPLMYAAKNGNIEIVRELLHFGAKDIDMAFYISCMEGYWDIAKELNNAGASNYNIAVSYAAFGGKLDIVKELINMGAKDINSALVSACEGGDIDTINYLIEMGANVNAETLLFVYRNYEGAIRKSPLSASKDLNITKRLIEAGATNLNDALIYNAKNNNTNMVFNLIELGADINSYETNNGKSVLMYSIEREDANLDNIKKLIELGADVQARDRNGNSVLIRSVMYQYEKKVEEYNKTIYKTFGTDINIIEELLKAGANPTDRNNYDNTAYRLAARKKRKDVIELFDSYIEKKQ